MAMKPKIKIGAGRYQQTYDARDDMGKRTGGGLLWTRLGAAPKFYQPCTERLNKFNVIPFIIKSANHPEVVAGRMAVGEYDFVLDFWVHRKIGPNELDVICPKNTYGKKCPICEERGRLYDAGEDDSAKDIKPTRRVAFNVQPIGKDGPEPLQVFEVSHYLFMKELTEEANAMANGNGVINYADLDDGKVVAFRASEGKMGTQKMTEFKSFKFLSREEELDAELVEQAISFDDLLVVHSYEELEGILYGKPEQETEHAPAGTKAPAGKPAPKAEKVEETDAEAQAAAAIGKEMDAPPAGKADKAEKPAGKATAPAATEKADSAALSCPKGHKWGTADEHNECARCKLWDACNAASK